MTRRQKGFTLLFAVLVSSLILALGLSIANITLKEVALSGTGRESQFAFYAADTGTECALYWDIKGSNVFATSSESAATQPTGPFPCVNEDIFSGDAITGSGLGAQVGPPWNSDDPQYALNPDTPTLTTATTTFEVIFKPEGYCAIVKVGKYVDQYGDEHTNIDSRGYNTCDLTSTLRTERGLQVTY